jgi:Phosphotransferase enzyme family
MPRIDGPLVPRPVAGSVDELVAHATSREPLVAGGKSGAALERVVIDGESLVVKYIDRRDDWIMRQLGDLRGYPITVWSSGVLDLLPACIENAYVGAAHDGARGAILMRDVAPWIVPDDGSPLSPEQHLRFLDHLAAVHAACWGFDDSVGLVPLGTRYCWFGRDALDCERDLGFPSPVPKIADEGWARLPDVAPRMAEEIVPLRDAPWPLIDALGTEPHTLLHGDWKLANLGSTPDGRTVLLDWALPGAGPPLVELAHYLGLNSARFPPGHTKEAAITEYRVALERHGVDTKPWFDRQLPLALVGMMVLLGWEKALGDDGELRWWEDQVLAWAAR